MTAISPPSEDSTKSLGGVVCEICGAEILELLREDHCPHCNSPARTRSLPLVLDHISKNPLDSELTSLKPLLGFATTRAEQEVLKKSFTSLKSVSLFGNYGGDHIEGVDARDLSRFEDGEFSGVFSILLFDYFVETLAALKECFRVTAPGGILFTCIGHYRLVDGTKAPSVKSVIKPSATYFDYVPSGKEMVSIEIGRQTFVDLMKEAGFIDAEHQVIFDRASGQRTDWFIGRKAPLATLARKFLEPAQREPSGQPVSRVCSLPLKTSFRPEMGRNSSPLMLKMRLSVPILPKGAHAAYFAEHAYDRKAKKSTPNVIMLGRNLIVESLDNGDTWSVGDCPDGDGRHLYNCFSTDEGNHIVQCQVEKSDGGRSKTTNPQRATIFLFDSKWKLISIDDTPTARWHGRASIDQCGDTIMFAEYHDNEAKYQPQYADDIAKWRPLMSINRVLRSRDGGRTWSPVFEGHPEEIRHFHTLQADPFSSGTWWLSSGDRAEESRVWRSLDDGDSWHDVSQTKPNVILPPLWKNNEHAVFRFTDLVVGENDLLWGSDDLLGLAAETDPKLALRDRAGSRVYISNKSDTLDPVELCYVGNPVRSIIDVGPAYVLLTEAHRGYFPLRPQIMALFKDDMKMIYEVTRADNFSNFASGFSYSKASRASLNSRFFSFRAASDVFDGVRPCILQYDLEFSD